MATAIDVSHHLKCPICKNLFEVPVTTGCGHSFCLRCIHQHISMNDQQCPLCQEPVFTKPSVDCALETILREFLQMQMADLSLYTGEKGEIPCNICEENRTSRAVKSCLTCLLSYCERHLKRHQSLERHRAHKLVSPVERLDKKACRVHGRPLKLYCKRDKRLICTLCVKTGEDIISMETERERREAEQQITIKGLESMIIKSENKLEDLQIIVTKDQELLAPLEDGRSCLQMEMAEQIQQIQNEILKYREIIDHLNQNKKEEDDIVFLQSHHSASAEIKHDWSVSIDTELKFGSMRNINSTRLASIRTHLESLRSFEMRRIQRFSVDVILHADSAHPSLEVSQDGKTVRERRNICDIRGAPHQFDLVGGILGKLQITSGRAFWVVEVGEKTSWELGVVRENANRKGKVSYKPKEGYWAIVLCASNLYGAFEDPPLQLHLSTKPQKVGVFVDYEDALVSFYNMNNRSHIYSFTQCDFNETLRPYFYLLPNKYGNNSHPMTICSVNTDDISM